MTDTPSHCRPGDGGWWRGGGISAWGAALRFSLGDDGDGVEALLAGSSPRRATYFLCLAKESRQRKATPLAVSLRFAAGNLRCSVAGRRCGTRFVRCAHAAQTTAASQSTKRGMLRCRARPTPCASRHGQRGGEVHSGHRCARPWFLSGRCFARRAVCALSRWRERAGVRVAAHGASAATARADGLQLSTSLLGQAPAR